MNEYTIPLLVVGVPAAATMLAVLLPIGDRASVRETDVVGLRSIEASPRVKISDETTQLPRIRPRHRWDAVDQHWGETQWMMKSGGVTHRA